MTSGYGVMGGMVASGGVTGAPIAELDAYQKAEAERYKAMAAQTPAGERAGVPFEALLSNIAATADQLRAVRYDLTGAWSQFQYGSEPPVAQAEGNQPGTADRIEAALYVMQEMRTEIEVLASLAVNIRRRA